MTVAAPRLRAATPADGAACAAIYAPFVEHTSISFEERAPTADEMAARIERALVRHAWLVAERDPVDGDSAEREAANGPRVVGYAYAGDFRARSAYRFACESSVYLADDERGRGTGRLLMRALVERLAELGFTQVVAGATLPNPASERLHASLGFRPVGRFERVGRKFGRWHDVGFWQLDLGAPPDSAS